MKIYKFPGEDDCCYVEEFCQLYEVDEAGWVPVEPEPGVPPEIYNEIVLEGSDVVPPGRLSSKLWESVVDLMNHWQPLGGKQ